MHDAGPGPPSGSHGPGTRAARSRIAAWRLRHRAGGPGRRGGCRKQPSESPGPNRDSDGRTAAPTTHPAVRRLRQLSADMPEGLEFNVDRGGSGSPAGPGPAAAVVATGRRQAACPRPTIRGGYGYGCPGLIMPSVLQVAGLAHARAACTRRRKGVRPLLLLSRGAAGAAAAGNETPEAGGSGPIST